MWKDSGSELEFLDYEYLINTVESIVTKLVLFEGKVSAF